jgi:hypothetical protein
MTQKIKVVLGSLKHGAYWDFKTLPMAKKMYKNMLWWVTDKKKFNIYVDGKKITHTKGIKK